MSDGVTESSNLRFLEMMCCKIYFCHIQQERIIILYYIIQLFPEEASRYISVVVQFLLWNNLFLNWNKIV